MYYKDYNISYAVLHCLLSNDITLRQINFMPQAEESSITLLIIDSSSFIIERLVSMLKEVRIIKKIFTANNYDNALDVLQKTKTDVVSCFPRFFNNWQINP